MAYDEGVCFLGAQRFSFLGPIFLGASKKIGESNAISITYTLFFGGFLVVFKNDWGKQCDFRYLALFLPLALSQASCSASSASLG